MRTIAIAAVAAFIGLGSPEAFAQNKAAAEALFKDGRRLMKAKKYKAACKKFAASHQIDPAIGTLLNLATCYERSGKIASAWARFVEAADKAKRARQKKRVRYARKKARALAKRVPKLKIVAPSIEGLEVRRDGEVVNSALLDTSVPIDPGKHQIEATAPGYESFTKSFVARQRRTVTVKIPELKKKPEPKKIVRKKKPLKKKPKKVAKPLVGEPEGKKAGRGRRVGGATLAIAGLAMTGVGLVFGAQASSKWNEAFDDGHCNDNNVCNQTGFDLTEDAKSKATLSTVFVGIGLVAAGVGGYLYLTAPKSSKPRVEASVGTDSAMILVRGGF